MFNKTLFILAQQAGDPGFYPAYRKLVRGQWRPYAELKADQDKQLKQLIRFAYRNVPYYHKLFRRLQFDPEDFKRIEDLEKLPVLTKSIIKQNWEDFKPSTLSGIKYYDFFTSGATGTPFKFRVSRNDRFFGRAMLFRGWGYGNYVVGDRTLFLAGTSIVGKKSYLTAMGIELLGNIKRLSSLDMDSGDLCKYIGVLNDFRPRFLRGYASSINYLAKYIEENNIEVPSPLAVFTTADNLYPHIRKKIEQVFDCPVHDTYGLNDGGVSAYECGEHSGLHIDTERSVMEIVDSENSQLENGAGRILATSLYNYAMPFIRYDTGDMGNITDEVCGCGRKYKLLRELIGRQNEILVTPDGNHVHGAAFFFYYVIREYSDINDIIEFQIIQKSLDKIVINMVCRDSFDYSQLDRIRQNLLEKSGGWNVEFRFVARIERTKAGKYLHVISELENSGETPV